jgi:hypothetical protein
MASSIRAVLLVEMVADAAGATTQNLVLTRPIRVYNASNVSRATQAGGTVQVFHVTAGGAATALTDAMVATPITTRTDAATLDAAQQDFVAGETIRATQAGAATLTSVYAEIIPLPITGN